LDRMGLRGSRLSPPDWYPKNAFSTSAASRRRTHEHGPAPCCSVPGARNGSTRWSGIRSPSVCATSATGRAVAQSISVISWSDGGGVLPPRRPASPVCWAPLRRRKTRASASECGGELSLESSNQESSMREKERQNSNPHRAPATERRQSRSSARASRTLSGSGRRHQSRARR
jgi:hypothetical protein